MESNNRALGDSFMVKPDVTERVTGSNIGGWQGRLLALSGNGDTLTLQWDSFTLKNIPLAYIVGCEDWAVSWSTMCLAARDVLPTPALDDEEDVKAALAELETHSRWLSLGEQGKRVQLIVNRAKAHDVFTAFETWHTYLQEQLVFPFTALVVEAQRGPVPQGTQVIVTEISMLDDTVGTVVRTRLQRKSLDTEPQTQNLKRRVYHFPLCELRATNASAEMEQLISDYVIWFTHHDHIYGCPPLSITRMRL